MGFSGSLMRLFTSYLHNRRQYVMYMGETSHLFESPSGRPQGSNLGPYLFLLFINDICQGLRYAGTLLYADDLKLFMEIQTNLDAAKLQNDLDTLASWSTENSLPFNVQKCSKISFTLKNTPINTSYAKK